MPGKVFFSKFLSKGQKGVAAFDALGISDNTDTYCRDTRNKKLSYFHPVIRDRFFLLSGENISHATGLYK